MAKKKRKKNENKNSEMAIRDAKSFERLRHRAKEQANEMGLSVLFGAAPYKMSDIIIKYAQSLLENTHGVEEYKACLSWAIQLWNMASFPDAETEKPRRVLAKSILSSGLADTLVVAEVFVSLMIEYQRSDFAGMDRIIMDFEILDFGDELRLNVVHAPLEGLPDWHCLGKNVWPCA
jgi:hypothetical protein